MINDMASFKQAMGQMDADDATISQAAKDRAAQILSDSKLSFSKMAELIEQRRLLLRPKIVASIRRMDQPELLGDAAFRDAGTSLRREGQSFRQIAEALELNGGMSAPSENAAPNGEILHPFEMEDRPRAPAWLRALTFGARIFFFPIRHPIRSFVIALIVFSGDARRLLGRARELRRRRVVRSGAAAAGIAPSRLAFTAASRAPRSAKSGEPGMKKGKPRAGGVRGDRRRKPAPATTL